MAGKLMRLQRLAAPPAWAAPIVICLGLLAAVLEGAGLILFIPLLQSLGAPSVGKSFLQRLLDHVLQLFAAQHVPLVLVTMLCGIILLKNVVSTTNYWITQHVIGMVSHRLRTRIFDQTLSSCIDYAKGVDRADLATTISTNSWTVGTGLTLVYRIITSIVTMIVFFALMISISPVLTLYAVICLAMAGMIIRFWTRQADATGKSVVEENKRFGLRMWENIESLQLIRAFGQEEYERGRFRTASDHVRRQLLRLDLLWSLPGPISEIAITVLIGLLIVAASRSGIGIAALAAFLSLLYRTQGPVRDTMQSKVALDGLAGSIDDVENLLAATREPFLRDGDRVCPPIAAGIEFRDVWFRYGHDQPWALKGVSFTIPVGKTTAIVGESGAGKSTLLSLLFRFYDPEQGAVLADGIALPAFSVASWRERLAVMSQDVQLFADTIRTNIAYGQPDVAMSAIEAAAAVARANGFIADLPDGYDTLVGDRGLRLSGGQRQRIALARTVLRNPDVLLLDEATNALDIESEQAFQLALDRYAHRRTVVAIAHRLTTIQNADQIIVMARGRVVEVGAPADLLRAQGHFARMLKLQQQGILLTQDITP